MRTRIRSGKTSYERVGIKPYIFPTNYMRDGIRLYEKDYNGVRENAFHGVINMEALFDIKKGEIIAMSVILFNEHNDIKNWRGEKCIYGGFVRTTGIISAEHKKVMKDEYYAKHPEKAIMSNKITNIENE